MAHNLESEMLTHFKLAISSARDKDWYTAGKQYGFAYSAMCRLDSASSFSRAFNLALAIDNAFEILRK